jgi:hypothetical protein
MKSKQSLSVRLCRAALRELADAMRCTAPGVNAAVRVAPSVVGPALCSTRNQAQWTQVALFLGADQ